MTTPDRISGGTEAQRGFVFQTYAVLLYMLIRRIELPRLEISDLHMSVEPAEGEDATFISCRFEADQPIGITEFVQCKKSESHRSRDIHAGVDAADQWATGPINYNDFQEWLTRPRVGRAAVDDLRDRSDAFFTAIVFGEPARRVQKYVPAGVVSRLWWYSPAAARAFPADYSHPVDPAAGQLDQKTFGTSDVRRKIRVLVVDSPVELQGQCEILLRQYFGVRETMAPVTVRLLRSEIEKRALSATSAGHVLSNAEIDAIIAAGRASPGCWQNVREVLRWGEVSRSTVRFDQPLSWVDFENGLYAARPALREAAQLLLEHRAVVASGPRGSGHTTLARYVAYEFLTADGCRNAYFLTPAHTTSLVAELEFLVSQIGGDTLFIIDDEHLGVREQIERVVETFLAFHREHKAKASLLVTSRFTYSPSQHKEKSALNDFAVVHLAPLSIDECSLLLQWVTTLRGSDAMPRAELIARASEGNLSVAMLLLQCAQEWKHSTPIGALLRHRKIGEAVTTWLLEKIGRPGDHELMRGEIAPIFIAGFHHLRSPESLSKVMPLLHAAGLVEGNFGEGETTYFPSSAVVASIVRNQYQDLELNVVTSLLRLAPRQSPTIFSQLDRSERGRTLLRALLEIPDVFRLLQKEINDPIDPMTLDELSAIFEASYRSNRSRTQALLRAIAEPQGRPNTLFFVMFLRRDRAKSVDGIARFLTVLDRIDRYPVRRLPYDSISSRERNLILTLFEYDFCPLDAAARCLRAVARCSRPFAQQLYRNWIETTGFAEKLKATDAAPDGLSVWLRFCDALVVVERHESQRYMIAHLSPDRVARAIFSSSRFEFWLRFLLQFRRLHPRLASTLAKIFLHEHRGSLDLAMRRVDSLGVLVNQLYAISRFSRRAAVAVAFNQMDHAVALVRTEQDQHRSIGSALNSLRQNISQKIARALAEEIDAVTLLASIQAEPALNFIGRTLYNIHQVSPALARTVMNGLDVSALSDRFGVSWLNQFAYLIRGLVVATDPARRQAFIDDLVRDPAWLTELDRAWKEADLLSDLAFFGLTMLEVGVSRESLLAMLSCPNVETLQAELQDRLETVSDPLELAHGLGLLGRLSLYAAAKTLSRYVDGSRTAPPAAKTEKSYYRPRSLPKASPYASRNLSHVGTLLQVAAAIEPQTARRLTEHFDQELFIRYATDDPNLGRATDFILGLNRASRARARDFVQRTAAPPIWQRQWEATEELANAFRYAHALRQVSLDASRRYAAFLHEEYRDDIEGLLDAEADLEKVSNWAHTLSVGGQKLDSAHGEYIARVVAETAEFDSRVIQLLDAAQALIECGQIAAAASTAELALRNGSQLESLRGLALWVAVFNRAVSIARAIGDSEYPAKLLSNLDAAVLGDMIEHDSSVVLAAHAAHLAATCQSPSMDDITNAGRTAMPFLRTRAMAERNITARVISLTLTDTPPDQVRRSAASEWWNSASDAGLAGVIFGMIHPAERSLFDMAPQFVSGNSDAAGLEQQIAGECDEHASNLTYGLALRLAVDCGLADSIITSMVEEARERSNDESKNVVKWTLDPQQSAEALLPASYYRTSLLKETVLQARYYIDSAAVEEVIVDMVRARKA